MNNKQYTNDEITSRLAAMTTGECLNTLVEYARKEGKASDFEEQKYLHNAIELIKTELLKRV